MILKIRNKCLLKIEIRKKDICNSYNENNVIIGKEEWDCFDVYIRLFNCIVFTISWISVFSLPALIYFGYSLPWTPKTKSFDIFSFHRCELPLSKNHYYFLEVFGQRILLSSLINTSRKCLEYKPCLIHP